MSILASLRTRTQRSGTRTRRCMIPGMRFEYEYRRKRLSTSTMAALPEHHDLPKLFLSRSLGDRQMRIDLPRVQKLHRFVAICHLVRDAMALLASAGPPEIGPRPEFDGTARDGGVRSRRIRYWWPFTPASVAPCVQVNPSRRPGHHHDWPNSYGPPDRCRSSSHARSRRT